MLLAVTNS